MGGSSSKYVDVNFGEIVLKKTLATPESDVVWSSQVESRLNAGTSLISQQKSKNDELFHGLLRSIYMNLGTNIKYKNFRTIVHSGDSVHITEQDKRTINKELLLHRCISQLSNKDYYLAAKIKYMLIDAIYRHFANQFARPFTEIRNMCISGTNYIHLFSTIHGTNVFDELCNLGMNESISEIVRNAINKPFGDAMTLSEKLGSNRFKPLLELPILESEALDDTINQLSNDIDLMRRQYIKPLTKEFDDLYGRLISQVRYEARVRAAERIARRRGHRPQNGYQALQEGISLGLETEASLEEMEQAENAAEQEKKQDIRAGLNRKKETALGLLFNVYMSELYRVLVLKRAELYLFSRQLDSPIIANSMDYFSAFVVARIIQCKRQIRFIYKIINELIKIEPLFKHHNIFTRLRTHFVDHTYGEQNHFIVATKEELEAVKALDKQTIAFQPSTDAEINLTIDQAELAMLTALQKIYKPFSTESETCTLLDTIPDFVAIHKLYQLYQDKIPIKDNPIVPYENTTQSSKTKSGGADESPSHAQVDAVLLASASALASGNLILTILIIVILALIILIFTGVIKMPNQKAEYADWNSRHTYPRH